MDEAVTDALSKTASVLRTAARDHKRSEEQHRKRARELMRQLDELRQVCEAHGITLTVDREP